jgi:hypothetical protein
MSHFVCTRHSFSSHIIYTSCQTVLRTLHYTYTTLHCRFFPYDPVLHSQKKDDHLTNYMRLRGYSYNRYVCVCVCVCVSMCVSSHAQTPPLSHYHTTHTHTHTHSLSHTARDLVLKAGTPGMSREVNETQLARASKVAFGTKSHPCLFTLPLERSRVLMSDLWTL